MFCPVVIDQGLSHGHCYGYGNPAMAVRSMVSLLSGGNGGSACATDSYRVYLHYINPAITVYREGAVKADCRDDLQFN
ncbi:hypothetical protein M8C21_028637 [Ambrosia artemisiifolia]|uniref:Uncharacterized protein n=1 Tax=Ambrosia artemisiifolia TaxID=4212 RepID=A0AAD5C2E8_AMBAR|nr:hypothetical protein M8C21_028637 [Ambrosia artemisiifolia]